MPGHPAEDHDATVVGVIGARGGTGASVLAASLARRSAAGGLRTVLVDGALTGGGVDVLLGIEDETGLRWPDLHAARGEVGGDELAALLPTWHGVRVLSADRRRSGAIAGDAPADVMHALVGAHDVVVLDIDRGTAGAGSVDGRGPGRRGAGAPEGGSTAPHGSRGLVEAARCTVVVLTARRDLGSVAGAIALQDPLAALAPRAPVGMLVRGPAAGNLTAHDVATAAGLDLWGEIRTDPGLPGALERGEGPPARTRRGRPGDLGRAAQTVLDHARAVRRATDPRTVRSRR